MILDFPAKVVAATVAIFPLVFLYDDVVERYNDQQKIMEMVNNEVVIGVFAFGTSLSATGDMKATFTAMCIAIVFHQMYLKKTDSNTSETEEDEDSAAQEYTLESTGSSE